MTPTEFAAALRKLDNPREWTNALRKEYRKVGTLAAKWARAEMRSGTRGGARVARVAAGVRGSSTATGATVSVGGKNPPGTLAAVWGTKKEHTGWLGGWMGPGKGASGPSHINPNKAAGYADAPRNTLPWVGANWTVATAGTGPRGVNDALAKHEPELVQEFEDAAFAFMGRAFPHGFK
jgi:hypothetical protein